MARFSQETYKTRAGILSSLQHDVNEYEKGRVTLLLLMDVSTVFDAFDHTILLQRKSSVRVLF